MKKFASRKGLIGIDLSQKMLDEAEEKKVYAQLICDDICHYMETTEYYFHVIDTLVREVQEETGYQIRTENIGDYILVHEKRKGDPDDLMEMDSWYYFCDVTENAGERALDDYEKEYDYQVQWMRLDDIIKKNEYICIFESG